jgi:hypothetical protein
MAFEEKASAGEHPPEFRASLPISEPVSDEKLLSVNEPGVASFSPGERAYSRSEPSTELSEPKGILIESVAGMIDTGQPRGVIKTRRDAFISVDPQQKKRRGEPLGVTNTPL